ncbi:hypothetical protein [Virgibacillus kimchii]
MRQTKYGLILYIFLMLPPVATLFEFNMTIHMHMQMPLLAAAGMLMYPYLKRKFPGFFEKYNKNGIPGIILLLIVVSYWLLPRAMDEALTVPAVQVFKFISWPFLVGVPLRDSWNKLSVFGKNVVLGILSILFILMAVVYIFADSQLCNNYLIVEQITLGWAFGFIALALIIYIIQQFFIDHSEYE